MEKVINKVSLKQQTSDFQYWQQQTPQKRLKALEQIRQEYHQHKYDAEPRLQRVYTIIKHIDLDNLRKNVIVQRKCNSY
jgi:NAD(P)H-nitrite reductase large subunit